MAENLRSVSNIVKRILTEQPETRGNDNLLILKVLEEFAAYYGMNLEEISIVTFLYDFAGCEFPGFETIRRSRQKVQCENPDLKPDEAVLKFRKEQEKRYRAFAMGEVI